MRSHVSKDRRAWLIGAVCATGLWLFLFAFCDVRFDVNDDQYILRTFSGNWPGMAPSFHVYIHTLFTSFLSLLNRLAPLVPWFSIVQIALLWLCCCTVIKSIIQCFLHSGVRRPFLCGSLVGLCFTLLSFFSLSAVLTYTATAACLCAASVAQLMSVDCVRKTNPQILRSMGYSLFLLVVGYALRQQAAFAALGFCALAYLYRFLTCFGLGKRAKRGARPMIITLAAVVAVMGGLIVEREVEIPLRGKREYMAWQQARTSITDYIDYSKITPESWAAVGWSETDVTMLSEWYTLDSLYTTQAMEHIAQANPHAGRTSTPGAAVEQFRLRNPLIFFSLLALFTSGLFCLTGLLMNRKRLGAAVLCAAGALCAVLLLYLAWKGRLPVRAVMAPVLPAAALVFCLMPEGLAGARRIQRAHKALFCAAVCICAVVYTIPAAKQVRRVPSQWSYNAYAARDEIALKNPDTLFLFSGELTNDLRIFPDFRNGFPDNLLFWGGWMAHSEDYNAKLAAFGIDGEHFTARDWLNPAVRYLTASADEPFEGLVRYLEEHLGCPVLWERTQMDAGLYAYRFYTESITR